MVQGKRKAAERSDAMTSGYDRFVRVFKRVSPRRDVTGYGYVGITSPGSHDVRFVLETPIEVLVFVLSLVLGAVQVWYPDVWEYVRRQGGFYGRG